MKWLCFMNIWIYIYIYILPLAPSLLLDLRMWFHVPLLLVRGKDELPPVNTNRSCGPKLPIYHDWLEQITLWLAFSLIIKRKCNDWYCFPVDILFEFWIENIKRIPRWQYNIIIQAKNRTKNRLNWLITIDKP